LPYIPLEKEIDQFISGFHRSKYAPLLQLLKETGCRLSEAVLLIPEDFDFERKTIIINHPKKHGLPRQLRISDKLISMIIPLVRKTNSDSYLWKAPLKAIKHQILRKKKDLAKKLGNPNLLRISPKTFRHFKATMEYYKTKDILHVKRILGHKSIKSTLVYTHLINFESDEYTCRTAKTIKEATDLIEAGFEYVTEMEEIKLFRKRK
jgi:integrase